MGAVSEEKIRTLDAQTNTLLMHKRLTDFDKHRFDLLELPDWIQDTFEGNKLRKLLEDIRPS